ncbi:MAG: hypothetical protein M3460_10940 [Actinomycetota bacterium]|nr:hypothetical protein [Actinomycetota bacterium]
MSAKPKDAAWVLRMGRHGVQVLTVVLVLALVFTMVNVQQFAAQGHPVFGVQWWIAWLLDPMASLTMAAAIVFEGLLADYGKPKVGWLTATKWYAGVATWGMNIWSSAAAGSLAGVWLHSVAPGLVLGLAEAAPRVRRHMAEIITELEAKPEPELARTPTAAVWPAPRYQPQTLSQPSWVAAAQPSPDVPRPSEPVVPPTEPHSTPSSTPAPAAPPQASRAQEVPDRSGTQLGGVNEPVVAQPVPVVEPASVAADAVITPGPVAAATPPAAPEPPAAPAEVPPGPEPCGDQDLDVQIAKILDEAGDRQLGRSMIMSLLSDPKPKEWAVRQALSRVRAARAPVLNGAGEPHGRGSVGESGDQ